MYYVYQDDDTYFITNNPSTRMPYLKRFTELEDAEKFIDDEERKITYLQKFKNYASINVVDYRKVVEDLIKEFDNGNVETNNLMSMLNDLIRKYTHNPKN